MAVFYDTGGGDIYAGETREEVIAAMKDDIGEDDFEESEVFEVDESKHMAESYEEEMPTGRTIALKEAYTPIGHGYCIASENC